MAKKMMKVLSCLVMIAILMSTIPVISSNSASGTFEILQDIDSSTCEDPEHIYLDCGEYVNYFDISVKFYYQDPWDIERLKIDAATGESFESDRFPIHQGQGQVVFILDATHGKITLTFVDWRWDSEGWYYKFSYLIEESDSEHCRVYVEIEDPCCVGYRVHVDNEYQFTEGGDGTTPDGYCAFHVDEGTHTLKITKNGRSASKTINFQCNIVYRWVHMPKNWCEPTPTPPSDIVIEKIDWEPSNIVAGDPVTIKVIVKNKGEGKYISPGDVLFDIQAIDENNLFYGCAINERKKIYRDIGDLEAGGTKTLYFSFIFNIPYLAESLCIEMDDVHDGIRYNNKKWALIDPQVQYSQDKFDDCMRDGVLICLGGSSKLKPFLEAAGNVEAAIDLTFNGGILFDDLTEDLREGRLGDFFFDIAEYVVSIINLGEYDDALMKTINFFNIFKHIIDTGLSCAHVFQFYVDILEGWIRGGNSCGIESSGVVGASPIYILVEDEYGKEAGYDQSGTKKEEIDGSLVFTCDHFKTVLIPGKLDNKKITVVGYDRDVEPGKTISLASEGETDSSFTLSIVESSKTIIYEDVPVNPQTIGTIEINEYNPEYYLNLDYDGDGTTDNKVKPSSIETIAEISGGNVIFQDNFDSYSAGTFPSSGSWQLTYNGYGDSYQVVDNSQHVSATNTLKLEGRANWAASVDHPLAETPDQVIYEVDVKVTQPGSSVMNYPDAAIGLANPNIGSWGTRYAGVIFGNAENRVIQPSNIHFNFDQWYHIKVEADMNNRVYDVWLDDQLIASDISTSSNGDYTDIRLEGGNNAHTRVWFDNVYVYRGHYPFQDPNGGLNGVPDENTITNTIGMEFVPIPAGEFEMGSPSDEQGRWSDEGPVHHVNIENAFHMGRYEVTQKQWREIMGDNPSHFKGDDLPVERVSWNDVQEFIRKLNEKEGTNKYRLPSEAEWEYACRAGTTTRYSFGDFESKLGDYAWYGDNSGDKTHPVGQKKPNSWGLYDMHGNVREWVQDSWHDDYNGAPADGSAWEGDGAGRAFHGGCWFSSAWNSRSAIRNHSGPRLRGDFLGFRLLKSL